MFASFLRKLSGRSANNHSQAVKDLLKGMKELLAFEPVTKLREHLARTGMAVVCTRFDYKYDPTKHLQGQKVGVSGLGIVLTAEGFRVAIHSTHSGKVNPGDVGRFKLAGVMARRQIGATLSKVIMECQPGKMQHFQSPLNIETLCDRINAGIRYLSKQTGHQGMQVAWDVNSNLA
jgi:hypothetical protein